MRNIRFDGHLIRNAPPFEAEWAERRTHLSASAVQSQIEPRFDERRSVPRRRGLNSRDPPIALLDRELRSVVESEAGRTFLAEANTGWPYEKFNSR